MRRRPGEARNPGGCAAPASNPARDACGAEPPRAPWLIGRRDFLRIGCCSVAALWLGRGCSSGGSDGSGGEEEISYDPSGRPQANGPARTGQVVLWVEAATCTGCACSLLGSFAPASEDLLPQLRVEFQETLMEPAGARALDHLLAVAKANEGSFLLIVDGAIPVGDLAAFTQLGVDGEGQEYPAESLVRTLAALAGKTVALGTCASFGGIPGSGPYQGKQVSLADLTGKPPIRVPGCPPNPLWIAGTLSALLAGEEIPLDELGRPLAYFETTVHDLCPRFEQYDAAVWALEPGDPSRCLRHLGCRGPFTYGNCPEALWQGRSFCIKAGHPCIGCTSPGFLDGRTEVDGKDPGDEGEAASPFYFFEE